MSRIEHAAVETRTDHMPPRAEAELEAEAIRELERMQRTRDANRSGYKPKRQRWHNADRG